MISLWPIQKLITAYDYEVDAAKEIMKAKNHDYGASWEIDRAETITDTMRHKLDRVRSLEELRKNNISPQNAEGIVSELHDIMNYAVFRLIKEREYEQNRLNTNNSSLKDTEVRLVDGTVEKFRF